MSDWWRHRVTKVVVGALLAAPALTLYVFRRETWVAVVVVLDLFVFLFVAWLYRRERELEEWKGALGLLLFLTYVVDVPIILVIKGLGSVVAAVHYVLGRLP